MNSTRSLALQLRALSSRAPTRAVPSSLRQLSSSSRSSSSSSTAQHPLAPSASSAETTPADPSASSSSSPSHYLVTLLRSPLHLPPSLSASICSLGLNKRLSSAIVPITPTNAGYILKLKELVGVRSVTSDEVRQWGSREWREREGEGRQGSGLRIGGYAGENSVIRVGSERARGDERGFRVVR
ncbi:hypothetical protein JCM8547_007129 [Rhodosporidiobolus lusitaniae]